MKLREIAGSIIEGLEAFKGSRPAMNTPNVLIVRGMSRKKINGEEINKVLSNLLNDIGAEELDVFSEEAADIIGIIDERIRANIPIQGETDVYGIYRLKESLEAMNCHVGYTMGIFDNFAAFIVMWMDKSEIGPKFVEVVVVNTTETILTE